MNRRELTKRDFLRTAMVGTAVSVTGCTGLSPQRNRSRTNGTTPDGADGHATDSNVTDSTATNSTAINSSATPRYDTIDTADMVVVFEDTFAADALDETAWATEYPWGSRIHNYNGYAAPENVYVYRNSLVIEAEKKPQHGKTYTTGVVTPTREFSPGYFEASVKIPPTVEGFWPAFWMTPVDAWPPEIDIFEFFGADPRAQLTYHYSDMLGRRRKASGTAPVPDANTTYHTYAVDWRPDEIVWYIDGVAVFQFGGSHVTSQAMRLIFNLGIDAPFLGTPRDEDLPAVLEIDHVRVWER
ncbi:glycoside hydrolase family protein [Haloferax mucosum ATCC BAA-1512]|uniref:Glycoside hydrolase family protein n=1 Tax=Haloferax mucosum ATCC BAA-1512 TaxID=662479 RepID=M0IMU0_9EURY|nr:glycoside hydrolase family 16 protein [Haloferax mucosum]ELZ98025.1 glycoside hydrolase family protein [Haloferax mucosum ATCC BAA-1512]